MLKELLGYSQKLNGKLESSGTSIDLGDSRLVDALGEGNYTYLTIRDGVNTELVKATVTAGEIVLTRAQGNTSASTFPTGTCVTFTMTSSFIEDFVCSLPEECKPKPLPQDDCGCC